MRTDYDRLNFKKNALLENGIYTSVWFSPEEDYLAGDLHCNIGCYHESLESKSISESYGRIMDNPYWSTVSARNSSWRWCESATTDEEFFNDRTPAPDFLKEPIPIQMINAANKYGDTENCKLAEMLKNNIGLAYLALDGILLFTPEQFRKSILGYGWVYLSHTKEFGDKSKRFEKKALIDMSKGIFIPLNNVPKSLLK